MKTTLKLLLFSLFFSANSYAQFTELFTGSGGRKTSFGFDFYLGPKIVHGQIGSEDNSTVVERDLNGIGLDGSLGITWGSLYLGAGVDYIKWYQQDDPKDVQNYNLNATQKNYSAVFGLSVKSMSLLAKYHFSSEYEVSENSSAGASVSYLDPDTAFSVALLFKTSEIFYVGLEYTSLSYLKEERNGVESTLSSTAQMNFQSLGINCGIYF